MANLESGNGGAGRGGNSRGNFNPAANRNFHVGSSSGTGGRDDQPRFNSSGAHGGNAGHFQGHGNHGRGGHNGGTDGTFQGGQQHGQQQALPYGRFNVGSGFRGNGARQFNANRPPGRFNNRGGFGRGQGRGGSRHNGHVAVVADPTPPQHGEVPAQNQVSEAAAALIPVARQLASVVQAEEGAEYVDGANKQKKSDKPKCFRCGFTGHVLAECEVPICECCESAKHVSEECPLLDAPKPQVMIYGHYHDDLTFFGMILTDTYKPKTENTRLAMVTVNGGTMSIPQIARHLQRVVPVEQYNWEVMQVGQNVYKVMFPSKAELDRLTLFGGFRVPNSVCELKVDAWHGRDEPMWQLPHVWVRMEGVPERHTGDFLALWGLGTLFGKTAKVDMAYTRKHKILRILIGCADHTKVPKDLPLFIKDGFYNIHFVVEPIPVEEEGDMEVDDGHDGNDDDNSKKDDKQQEKTQHDGSVPEAMAKLGSSNTSSSLLNEKQVTPINNKKLKSGVLFSPLVRQSFDSASSPICDQQLNDCELPPGVTSSTVARVLLAERALLRGKGSSPVSSKADWASHGNVIHEDVFAAATEETMLALPICATPRELTPVVSKVTQTEEGCEMAGVSMKHCTNKVAVAHSPGIAAPLGPARTQLVVPSIEEPASPASGGKSALTVPAAAHKRAAALPSAAGTERESPSDSDALPSHSEDELIISPIRETSLVKNSTLVTDQQGDVLNIGTRVCLDQLSPKVSNISEVPQSDGIMAPVSCMTNELVVQPLTDAAVLASAQNIIPSLSAAALEAAVSSPGSAGPSCHAEALLVAAENVAFPLPGAAEKSENAMPAAAGNGGVLLPCASEPVEVFFPTNEVIVTPSVLYASPRVSDCDILPHNSVKELTPNSFSWVNMERETIGNLPEDDDLVFSVKEVIEFGVIALPLSSGLRSSSRLRSQPLADVHSMDRAIMMAQRRMMISWQVGHRATSWIQMWSFLLSPKQRVLMATGCTRLMAVVRAIFNQGGW